MFGSKQRDYKLASSVSKQNSNEVERANESEGAMKRWKNREVRSISKSKSDRWLVSVLTRFARPANQPINLKGIFLWNWDIDLSISPLAGRGLGGNFNPRPTAHSIIYLSLSISFYWKWEVGDIFVNLFCKYACILENGTAWKMADDLFKSGMYLIVKFCYLLSCCNFKCFSSILINFWTR